MKTKKYLLVLSFFGLCTMTSCSDWFDVDPKTDVKADDFFNSENGFLSSMQGIYTTMGGTATYGHNLSFGMLDQLALLYDSKPSGAGSNEDIFEYEVNTEYYNTKGRISETWISTYNLIANCNNLLRWIDKKGETVLDLETRNTLLGEIYGLRAFYHFDLLRLWGPVGYNSSDSTKYIPYRMVADNTKLPRSTQKVVVENIIADLKQAERYLAFEKGTSLNNDYADTDRRYRFNYYAAKALQARVYNYCGMKDEAFAAAKEVIDNCGLVLQTENGNQPAMYKETIFGIYFYMMSNEIISFFDEGPIFNTQYITYANTMQSLYKGFTGTSSDVDIRMKSTAFSGYDVNMSGTNTRAYISRKYIKNDEEIIPLIRLPEMYYIMCESADLNAAPEYINTVKSKRGYTKSSLTHEFADEEERLNALNLEYRMEYYAEGHYFYFLKRNNITSVDYHPNIVKGNVTTEEPFYFDEKKFIFPLPDNEKEYGWTEEE